MAAIKGGNAAPQGHWGSAPAATDLPNVNNATTQSDYLKVGHTCAVEADSKLYSCTKADKGAATWVALT